ncbi:IS30 family transposase [Gryllotalpicola reticulitermitis]|uniref:IS30 family transposase n=1 Tax=Gryllotalpicola reticulitermitis TaxID=1184153 RepID=A0ABV8QBY8_9MICO
MGELHENGFKPSDRSETGHWEGDLIIGPHDRSAIGTPVERQMRYVRLLHLPVHRSMHPHAALVSAVQELAPASRRTIIWDQGTEMAKHLDATADTGTRIYFRDAASSRHRDTDENMNGLLRQYFAKSTDLSAHTRARLSASLMNSTHAPNGFR